jgi:hypothetical protein
MAGAVEQPGSPVPAETIVTPQQGGRTRTRPSAPVQLARIGYAVLSSGFVACIIVQVFLAGMGAFGADWSWHLTFAHFLELPPLLMIPIAIAGRLSWGLALLPIVLLVLVGLQYAFAGAAVPTAALHPVNALLIFCLGLLAARRAWAAVARKG